MTSLLTKKRIRCFCTNLELLRHASDVSLAFPRFLRQQRGLNVRQNTSACNYNRSKQLAQFLVIAYGELNVTRNDPRLLVVASSITGQLQHLQAPHSYEIMNKGRIFSNGIVPADMISNEVTSKSTTVRDERTKLHYNQSTGSYRAK